ncbi:MAG: LicD family protein [Fidelibacterota bacterium]
MSGKYRLEGKNADVAVRMLEKITTIFEECGIKYVLTAGTLLGIYRENRFLPWDNDLDLRVFHEDMDKIIKAISKIKWAGYLVRVRYQHKDDPPLKLDDIRIVKIYNRKYLFTKGEVMMDCFIATRYNDQYIWSCGGFKHYTKKSVPSRYYDDLDGVVFKGKQYAVPAHIEEYLTFRYGDWKTPQEKWDYRKDDGAIIYSKVLTKEQEKSQ